MSRRSEKAKATNTRRKALRVVKARNGLFYIVYPVFSNRRNYR